MHYYEAVTDSKDRSPKGVAEFMRIAIDDTQTTFDTQFGKQLPPEVWVPSSLKEF
jgi:hypothetical protein